MPPNFVNFVLFFIYLKFHIWRDPQNHKKNTYMRRQQTCLKPVAQSTVLDAVQSYWALLVSKECKGKSAIIITV